MGQKESARRLQENLAFMGLVLATLHGGMGQIPLGWHAETWTLYKLL